MTQFIDFNKEEKIFYVNLYLDEFKYVLKIPIDLKEEYTSQIKIEKFKIDNSAYLLAYA